MSLLKNLLGSNTKDEQFAEEMRGVLQEMQKERARCENLTEGVRTASDRLQELGEPIAKVGGDVEEPGADRRRGSNTSRMPLFCPSLNAKRNFGSSSQYGWAL